MRFRYEDTLNRRHAEGQRSSYIETIDLLSRAITLVIRAGNEEASSTVVPMLNEARRVLAETARDSQRSMRTISL